MKTIMLVEDDLPYLKVLTFMMRDWGCRVIACRDGLEALGALEDVRPDLIISDLDMPLLDGIGLFKRYREMSRDPAPFVIISGIADAEARLARIREDLLGFYPKPVSVKDLKGMIGE
jgi:two-component system response regulator YesN